jgi:DNA-binding CsgD family transcriptional regulator/sugar-specific transcriptional regulator TrmB
VLESLGLDDHAERIYRALLARPSDGLDQLADFLGVREDGLRHGLDRLAELALIRPSDQAASGFRAARPEAAMEALLARQQAELVAQQLRVEQSRAAAARLIAECSTLSPSALDGAYEEVIGLEAIRERLEECSEAVEKEVVTFAPGGGHTVEDLEASRQPNLRMIERGVKSRTVYLDSVRNHQPTLDQVTWLATHGWQVRTVPTLPIRMIIMDRRVAVLPIDAMDPRAGAVVLTGPGTVTALYALFESVWSTAVPLGVESPRVAGAMSPQEGAVMVLLAQGLTDEAIAKRLGVSPRTARRLAADLMERLDARSRFEAGVHAVQDGWLSAER